MAEPRIAVWHRNDLRVRDNPALTAAAADGHPCPLFVFDPHFYRSERVSDGRTEFLHESLSTLDDAYAAVGSSLAFRHGDAVPVLRDLLGDAVDRIYLNADTTAGYARERDETVSGWTEATVFTDDAIVRDARNTRDGWQEQAESYFDRDPHRPPAALPTNPVQSTVDIDTIESEYGHDPQKTGVPTGGCEAGHERLVDFVDALSAYVGGISPPKAAEERTSHLSPYLKFGCLSLREVFHYAQAHGTDDRALSLFTERLFWNRHFTQKLADNPDATRYAVNPVFRGMNRERHDPALDRAWRHGETGFPLVDASMRALRQTGWLNFRMRAMCASFYTYILRCWWKRGADWFYRHLVDADPAINYQQWQMQSGLVGVHPLRIYNPRKQVRDNDPEGEFIRTYVPELRGFPVDHLDRPEKAPLPVQDDCGIRIGDDYPRPVVDFERRREKAREHWSALAERAEEALSDPEIRRRASLSRRGRDADRDKSGTPNRQEGQTSLDAFATDRNP